MFNLFGRKTAKDFMKEAQENYGVPNVMPVSIPDSTNREYYRVGRTDNGETTLTFLSDDGHSMTLTMNQDACEQMIRMLESTFSLTTNKVPANE
jgi:hypothetical protein